MEKFSVSQLDMGVVAVAFQALGTHRHISAQKFQKTYRVLNRQFLLKGERNEPN
jgi:hypothetical protein